MSLINVLQKAYFKTLPIGSLIGSGIGAYEFASKENTLSSRVVAGFFGSMLGGGLGFGVFIFSPLILISAPIACLYHINEKRFQNQRK